MSCTSFTPWIFNNDDFTLSISRFAGVPSIKMWKDSFITLQPLIRISIATITIKLKVARVAKDLSQDDLAKIVGVSRQTIGLIEQGKYNPSLNLCVEICKALSKTLDDLFWEEDEEE